jgi:hypothetical protein
MAHPHGSSSSEHDVTRSPRSALYKSHPELILNLGSCLAVLAIVGIVSYLLARERDSVEQSAIRSSGNIVQLIESDILRNVELYDQSLKGLIWAVNTPNYSPSSPACASRSCSARRSRHRCAATFSGSTPRAMWSATPPAWCPARPTSPTPSPSSGTATTPAWAC